MATFVSLVTCHHCPVVTSRRGLVYRDSLSALSWNLRAPGCPPHRPIGPRLRSKHPCTFTRPKLPESIALTRSKPPCGVRHLVLTHLRKLLTLSSPQQRGLPLPV